MILKVLVVSVFWHLMSLSLVLRQQDDGIGECGGRGLHLLHHHLSGAVNGQNVPWEILTGSASICGAGDCKNTHTCFLISSKMIPAYSSPCVHCN